MAIFDLYGFPANFLIYSKILLQKTWKAKIGWDEPLPRNLHLQWQLWWAELRHVDNFKVNRCYSPELPFAENTQLHIFTDAGESAFSAVGYLRMALSGEVHVAFVTAKTRCAPQKPLSVPRLELQAAVLGSRLQTLIKTNHNLNIADVVFWSDSRTVILWIQSSKRKYKPFVAHRIAEILDVSEASNWRWIPTDLNIADDATRAKSPPKFSNNDRWLSGPSFLYLPEDQWPQNSDVHPPEKLEEEVSERIFHLEEASYFCIDITKFSSYLRLKRVVAWILRYKNHLLRHTRSKLAEKPAMKSSVPVKSTSPAELVAKEIAAAEQILCQQAQYEAFHQEVKLLRKQQAIPKGSAIFELAPYLDNENVIRMHGRLDAAACLPYETRRPIILPQVNPLTTLIVASAHGRYHYQNDAVIINEVRRHFWIPRIRTVLKKIKRDCNRCKLVHAKPMPPLMGQMPPDRVTTFVRPFSYTGLDYFGPLQVTIGRRREKRWVALFTCLTIRAIHLELAADLSTDACILCIRNFINRRGTPVRIRSDNGTNFIGAQRELEREARLFDTDRIQAELSSKGIEWRFNCPMNPSEGGSWERMVQSVKKILKVTLCEEAPRVETLRSLLIEAESIINSRPLTELPLKAADDEPLTPNHFIMGCTNSTQTPILDDKPTCLRKQWLISQQLKNRFWKRWILEYLPELTRRTKWHMRTQPLKIGDLVLICDGSQPRSRWQRGRIEKVIVAKDGQMRTAEVKTPSGILRRPTSKLAVLDIDGESR